MTDRSHQPDSATRPKKSAAINACLVPPSQQAKADTARIKAGVGMTQQEIAEGDQHLNVQESAYCCR